MRLGLGIISRFPLGIISSAAYLFGCIQPDIAVLTYFIGTSPGEEGRGHSFRTAMRRIAELLPLLSRPGAVSAYRLGKITHYAADCFTFPHNLDMFSGSLAEHMIYERVLDCQLRLLMEGADFMPFPCPDGDPSYLLASMHRSYVSTRRTVSDDLSFIIRASSMLRASYCPGEPAQERVLALRAGR